MKHGLSNENHALQLGYNDLKSCLQCTALADLCKHTFCAVNFSFRCPGVMSLVAAGAQGQEKAMEELSLDNLL